MIDHHKHERRRWLASLPFRASSARPVGHCEHCNRLAFTQSIRGTPLWRRLTTKPAYKWSEA